MQTIDIAAPASTARDRQLYRLVDLHASTDAAAALHVAATRTSDPCHNILKLVDAVLGGASESARDQLRDAILSRDFAAALPKWMGELRAAASSHPDSGACTLATALKLWSWTLEHFRSWSHAPAMEDLVDTVTPLIASRCHILAVVQHPKELNLDLAHVYGAHVAALAGAACAELVFGYRTHLVWDAAGCETCYAADELDDLEAFMPGFASGARTSIDVIEADGSHPAKRGPCAGFLGLETFMRFRNRLDACLTGARVAKDRAAVALARRS